MWYDFGLDHNNSRQYLDITRLSDYLDYVKALPGIYAFTGNDYSPSFYRKGRTRPISLMNKHPRFVDAFGNLGTEPLNEETIATLEEFTCHMYGHVKQTDINEVTKLHFEEKTKPKPSQRPLDCTKSVEPTTFPPCKRVLLEHIKRSWFIAKLYKSSSEAYPLQNITPIDSTSIPAPFVACRCGLKRQATKGAGIEVAIDYGWKISDDPDFLLVKWFDGDQVPRQIP